MASFYRSTVQEFLGQDEEQILARLGIAYANRGYTSQYTDQTLTWQRDLSSLRTSLEECVGKSDSARSWGLLLEFSVPRKEVRVDIVLLIRDAIVVLEAKSGSAVAQAKRQVEEYALLLHYFHKASADRRIVPVIVSATLSEVDLAALDRRDAFPQMSSYWVTPIVRSSWPSLSHLLVAIEKPQAEQLSAGVWDESPYFPVPSIIEAAMALRSGLSIREIAHSEASDHEMIVAMQSVS